MSTEASPILLIASDFPPHCSGGIQRHYHDLCRFARGAIHVLAPAPACPEFDRLQPYRTFRRPAPLSDALPARMIQGLLLTLYGMWLALRHGYRHVLLGHWYLALFAAILYAPTRRPWSVMLHGGELAPYEARPWLRRLIVGCLRKARHLIVNSQFTRRQYIGLGIPAERLHVITPGVDTDRFQPVGERIRARYGLEGGFVLLTVATLVERKGHDVTIRALGPIAERIPEVHYLIVGAGPEEKRLREIARDCGVADRVTFAGRLPEEDLPGCHNAADVFVMPSRVIAGRGNGVEGFGIVYLEAGACGKPVIGGSGAGAEEAVAHGEAGLLVAPESVDELRDAVVLLAGDAALRAALGERGRRRAVEQFGLRARADRLTELLGGRGRKSSAARELQHA